MTLLDQEQKLLQSWGVSPNQTVAHNALAIERKIGLADQSHVDTLDELLHQTSKLIPQQINSPETISEMFTGITQTLIDHKFVTNKVLIDEYNPILSSCIDTKFLPPLCAIMLFVSVGQTLHLPISQVLYPGKGSFARWNHNPCVNWSHNKKELFYDNPFIKERKISRKIVESGIYLTSLSPNQSLAISLCSIGTNLLTDKHHQSALTLLNIALALFPNYVDGYVQRSQIYFELDDHNQSLKDLHQAVHLDPTDIDLYSYRARIFNKLKQYPNAILELTISLDFQKTSVSYNDRGLAYFLSEQYEKAIVDFEQAISLQPEFTLAYHNLGQLYVDQDKEEEAIKIFNRLVNTNPYNPQAYLLRSEFNLLIDNEEIALQDLKAHNSLVSTEHQVTLDSLRGEEPDEPEYDGTGLYFDFPDFS